MFLAEDGSRMGKQLVRMASKASSCRSWSSISTSASSTDLAASEPVPSTAMIQALIRDLSFWDLIPPVMVQDTFPSPLPKRPLHMQSQQQQCNQPLLQRGSSVREDRRRRSNERERPRGDGTSKGTISDHNNNPNWRPEPVWKTATDPMTGRTYYYDAVTRRTQWEKPTEVRQMEKQKKSQRRKRNKLFFHEMESNILKSLSRGELIPGIPKAKLEPTGPPLEPRNANRNFRTLSRMDDTILAELRDDVVTPEEFDQALRQSMRSTTTKQPQHQRSNSRGRPPLPEPTRSMDRRSRSRSRTQRQAANNTHGEPSSETTSTRTAKALVASRHLPPPTGRSSKPLQQHPEGEDPAMADALAGEHLLDGTIQAEIRALAGGDGDDKSEAVITINSKNHVRRNTGGTIYVNGTMSNPNVEATIKCVCGVYRAHLVQASEERNKHSPVSVMANLDIFNDLYHMPPSVRRNLASSSFTQESLPSLADIVEFYQEFYRRSQMEFDTIIMSLIYVERLIKTTNVVPGPTNWRSVLFSCMVLASKVWDDLSMWNIDFSNVASANSSNNQQAPGLSLFTLQRVNQLELVLLKSLGFNVRVPASEYAKYYFLIRTMLLRSGLLEGAAKPLGKEEAKVLENRTSQYQDSKLGKQQRDRRTKSMFDYTWMDKPSNRQSEGEGSGQCGGPVLKDKVCLEQLVNMR
ncbi:Cyclin [Seminavis robusta]|uniref:Cyclin n=1 Tax=Seminavis robusta TaxID=568900 RepID=A0A9N8HJZ1_9STRA|nr:Cyclin [Seminavis robusta]|eukprot:Sro799_g204130.1 Cyclin (691) ;mRNA; f:27126-29292